MKKVLISLFLCLLFIPTIVQASLCAPHESLYNRYKNSEYVYVIEFDDNYLDGYTVTGTGIPWSRDKVSVLHTYKGDADSNAYLQINSYCAGCDFDFRYGKQYIVFSNFTDEDNGDVIFSGHCAGEVKLEAHTLRAINFDQSFLNFLVVAYVSRWGEFIFWVTIVVLAIVGLKKIVRKRKKKKRKEM